MALTTLDLKIDLYLNAAKDAIILTDTTGLYNATYNPLGYGSPNGIFVNDVDTLKITLNYTITGVSAIYLFTIVNGTITAATIAYNGATAENILPDLTSTVFPFTSANPFTFLNSYTASLLGTITLPLIEDGAYSVVYEITGSALDSGTPTNFDLSTSKVILQTLASQCCIDEIWNKADANCGCDDSKFASAKLASTYLDIANYAASDAVQDTTKANLYITKAKSLCDCGCGC